MTTTRSSSSRFLVSNRTILIAKYVLIGVISFFAWPLALAAAFVLIVVKGKTLERQRGVLLLVLFAAILRIMLYHALLFPRLNESHIIGRTDLLLVILFPIEFPAVQEAVIRLRVETLTRGGDPFGNALIMSNDELYSLGPTGVDDPSAALYDPTNGTVSIGRIRVPYQRPE
jgi:hypothetical protein